MACRSTCSSVNRDVKWLGSEAPNSPIVNSDPNSPSLSVKPTPKTAKCCANDQNSGSKSPVNVHKSVGGHKASTKCAAVPQNSLSEPSHVEKCAQRYSKNSPNEYIWQRIESLIDHMISEEDGIPVRNVKSLMSTIPSTFTGSDVVQWLIQHVGASDVVEAVNLASRIASMGYLFCIDDHVLTVKNDNHTYYRFQTPFLYPSRCMEADTVDYAVYLCKRTMQNKQRLELAGFEAERLASLQTLYCHKWEFVYIQAEAEAKVDKKRDKLERLVLDSQERAYWDVHRPPPGCVNTTDVDMRKLCRAKRPKKAPCRPIHFPVPSGPGNVFNFHFNRPRFCFRSTGGDMLFSDLDGLPLKDIVAKLNASFRPRIKTSKAAESLQNYCDQYSEFDLLLSTSSATPATTGALGTSSSGQAISSASACQLVTLGATRSPSPNNAAPLIGSKTNIDKIGVVSRVDPGATTPGSVASFQVGGIVGSAGGSSSTTLGRSGSGGGGASSNLAAGPTVLSLGAGGTGPYGSLGHVMGTSNATNANFDSTHESVSTLNPWISDNPEYWNTEVRPKFLPIRRIKRWSFSIHELLKDPIGLDEFQRWLEKEFSAENLRFWQACQVSFVILFP
ncbi:Regulator of G-protein signaling 7 [Fasciolopsis buskii]|uniref:Regulator of G-protein signaling 7 n=1 Tax=Fasciolopsis buskii TaxID=27845 RepID=A0A8E0VDZ9_9TREM|nr:Regulator of G-protein signaling 7 [Fasciolopsis buski]